MKKILSIVLTALMAVSMSISALAAEDPAALLERVNAKNSDLNSMDCDMGVHAVVQLQDPDYDEELSMNLDMAMKVQMDQINSGNLRYKADMAMEFMGVQQYATVFYKDGYYYMNSDGTKLRYPMDLDAMIEKAKGTASFAPEIEAAMMSSLSVREENGMRILSYEADASAVDRYVKEAMNDLLGDTGIGMMDMNIRQIKGEYVINQEDYCTAMDIYMVMDMSVMDEKMTIIMLIESDINNPGQPVNVSLPSTDGYEDLAGYYY